MPSIEGRLQRVEDRSVADHEVIHGGPNLPWEQSIRGKLHALMNERHARKMEQRAGLARFSRTEAICLLAFGLIQTGLATAALIVAIQHG